MKILLAALLALVSQIGTPAQTASIEGIVVKLGTGEAVPNAAVQLQPQGIPPAGERGLNRTARSDQNGRFTIENIVPGTYRLTATHEAGYVPAEYGQRSPSDQGIGFSVVAGQKMSGVRLTMSPTGSIVGRIYGRNGEPLGNAQVMALRQVYKDGSRALTIVQTVASDDRGEYRLFWLPPGRYYVGARPEIAEGTVNPGQAGAYKAPAVHVTAPARFGTFEQSSPPSVRTRKLKTGEVVEEMYLTVYYPATLDSRSAAPVAVAPGATVGGIDVTTEAGLIRPHHVRGRILDATTGQPVANASVVAAPRTNDPYFTTASARSDSQGGFDLAGMAPGSYRIHASRYGEAVAGLNAVVSLEVADKDIENLTLAAIPQFKLAGRFFLEGGGRSYPASVQVNTEPPAFAAGGGNHRTYDPPSADGAFVIDGMTPGDFRVAVQGMPAGSYIRSIRLSNTDVLNDGLHLAGLPQGQLEIVIGANGGNIEGSVTDARQQPLGNRAVVLVPDPRLRHRADLYGVAFTDAQGRFRIRSITPGEYKLFAWDSVVERGAWRDPAFIGSYENAGRAIHIDEGTNENVQLTALP